MSTTETPQTTPDRRALQRAAYQLRGDGETFAAVGEVLGASPMAARSWHCAEVRRLNAIDTDRAWRTGGEDDLYAAGEVCARLDRSPRRYTRCAAAASTLLAERWDEISDLAERLADDLYVTLADEDDE